MTLNVGKKYPYTERDITKPDILYSIIEPVLIENKKIIENLKNFNS